jgi:hypothetical protein
MGSLIRGKAAAFAGKSLKFWHTSDRHPESRKVRHCSGIVDSNAAFDGGVILPYDCRSYTTEIIIPVQIELLGYE